MTNLVLPVSAVWDFLTQGLRWWMAPFWLLAAVSLGMWGEEVAKLVRKKRGGTRPD
ncbi:hypothetical protein [Streptomyces sp. NPDC059063]|uniref:hypothetical protein n=1 Tax=unclassified Streptomyces TaxID=2593676 RepID=UPI0036BFED4A